MNKYQEALDDVSNWAKEGLEIYKDKGNTFNNIKLLQELVDLALEKGIIEDGRD